MSFRFTRNIVRVAKASFWYLGGCWFSPLQNAFYFLPEPSRNRTPQEALFQCNAPHPGSTSRTWLVPLIYLTVAERWHISRPACVFLLEHFYFYTASPYLSARCPQEGFNETYRYMPARDPADQSHCFQPILKIQRADLMSFH